MLDTIFWVLLWCCWGYYVLSAIIGAIDYYKEKKNK